MGLQGGQDGGGRPRTPGRELRRSPLRSPVARPGVRGKPPTDFPRGRLRRKIRNAVRRGRQLREALQRQREGRRGPVLVLQEGRRGRLETCLHREGKGDLRPGSRRTTRQVRLLERYS